MRRRPRLRLGVALLALALLLLAGATVGAAPDPKAAATEAKERQRIAAVWVAAGTALKDKGRKAEAVRAVAEAKEADPKAAGLDDLAKVVDALADATGNDAAAADAVKKAAADAAKGWEKISEIAHDPKDDARYAAYLAKACELEPSKGRLSKGLAAAKALAGNKARPEGAGLLLARLRDADPDASKSKYDAVESDMALSDVALVKAAGHGLVAWMSLPKGWTKKGDWPVLVTVDGAGSNFLGSTRSFRDMRGSRRFIVLGPCTLSNTNDLKPETYPFYPAPLLEEWNGKRLDFDLPGLVAILSMLSERFGAAKKVAITGFSGGGNLCYSLTMRRPDLVWASAPACANFQPGLAGDATVADGGPPVHILTGEKDPHRNDVFGSKPGIEGQADWAQEAFTRLGFKHVKRTMLPGVGHSSCPKEVWSFLDEVLAAK